MTNAEKAVALHRGGSACSQAVFTVLAEELGLDPRAAHKLSTGLGGGIGRLGLSCGAITGGVLALSLAFGSEDGADQDAKLDTYARVAAFVKAMEAKHGSSQCRVLLGGADLWTEEGRAAVKAGDYSDKVCNALVADVVEYVGKEIAEGKRHG
jgi:C_GCAxxG_C_C family probable redox protein